MKKADPTRGAAFFVLAVMEARVGIENAPPALYLRKLCGLAIHVTHYVTRPDCGSSGGGAAALCGIVAIATTPT